MKEKYSSGKIFLSKQPSKRALGNMTLMKHEVLTGGTKLCLHLDEASHLILLPVTGNLICRDVLDYASFIETGSLKIYSLPANSRCVLLNPYETEVINFLQIRIKDSAINRYKSFVPLNFDFDANKNELIALYPLLNVLHSGALFRVSIGKFSKKTETVYILQQQRSKFYAYVIAGSFEIDGWFLEQQDGLALWDVIAVGIEALSDYSILLVLEFF
jgi:hypothetical protein